MTCFASEQFNIWPIVSQSVEGGSLVALALVCLVQYFWHAFHVVATHRRATRYESEITHLTTEKNDMQKDRWLSRMENEILRNFLSANEEHHADDGLLTMLAPETSHDFAALLRLEGSRFVIERSRGLSKTSCREWNMTIGDLKQLDKGEFLILNEHELRQSAIWTQLSAKDRQKAQELIFFPVGFGKDLCGGIVSTAFYPAEASREDQLELARRLMGSLGKAVKQRLTWRKQEHETRFTEELLQLRSLADRSYTSPLDMVQTYLSAVQSMLEADGASLFLLGLEGETRWRPMARCEPSLNSSRLLSHWEQHEARLLNHCDQNLELQAFDAQALNAMGIETLMRSALLVPLLQNQQLAGLFCFTRCGDRPFESPQRQLAVWAAQHLGKTLVRLQTIADFKRQAQQDGLTELANRRTFDQQLERELRVAQRAKLPCSLLLCDLDRFKPLNDTHGHQAGDEVLRVVARILQKEAVKTPAGERALTARYGGEELAVILPGQGEKVAVRVAEAIRKAICHESVWWEDIPIQVTMSIGVSTFPTHAESAAELLAVADEALYLAKESGRNQVCFAPIESSTAM